MCAANDPQARRLARTDSAALRACRRLGEMGIVHTPLSGVVGGCGLRCVSRSIAGVWRLALGSTALDRNELGALLVAAGLGPPAEHALISLLALNGLRVSEATGADIEHLGVERGHRTLVITRKGGKVVTVPLAPRTARAIDLAVGERTEGPLFLTADGRRLDRHGAARVVRRVTRRAQIAKHVSPQTLRHAFITAALDAGVPLRDVQEAASHADPRTTMRYDRARTSLDRHATYIVAAFIAGAAW